MNLYLIKMKINLKIEMITQFYDSLEKSHPLIMKVGRVILVYLTLVDLTF